VLTGKEEVHEFKTETKRLLNIVANSLYSEKEASDAGWESVGSSGLTFCRSFTI
jgi:hypothetical protein